MLILVYLKHLNYILVFLLVISATAVSLYISSNGKGDYSNSPDSNSLINKDLKNPSLAIIIDDFGLDRAGIKEMMQIDRHLTFAVMPFLRFSKKDAVTAHEKGYEVIVHLPMQSSRSINSRILGPNPVKLGQDNEEIKKIVSESIEDIPYVVGVNIHMGSISSEDERVMTCVMEIVREKKLYFVDSRTSQKTVCDAVAKKLMIKFARRNVFLEHESKSIAHVKKQLNLAGDIALKKGYAIAVGHVGYNGGEATAEAIKEMIPEFESRGIKLVFVS